MRFAANGAIDPPSQPHGGTKWFGKPSPDRQSIGTPFILVFAAAPPNQKSGRDSRLQLFIKCVLYKQSTFGNGEMNGD